MSFSPSYINTGILTVVRGRYVEEEDPLYRLDEDVADKIANELGIASSDLKYVTRANIGLPVEPTQAMKAYVKSDDHEIIGNLPTVSVDQEGIYVIPITLSDDIWQIVQGKDINSYKFYALNDSQLGEGQMRPAIVNGLISTWELFSLTGEKMDIFSVKTFLMVGFLQAAQPFSLYIAKLLLYLLLAGCNSGYGFTFIIAVSAVFAAFMLMKRKH